MRTLVKQPNISFTNGTRSITISNEESFTAEDIRLIVNETQKVVIASSMQKDNITSVNSGVITFSNSLPTLATNDILTIEIDFGNVVPIVSNVEGTINISVTVGNILRLIADDSGQMVSATGVTVTEWKKNDVVTALPFNFSSGDKIEATLSGSAPFSGVLKYNKVATAKNIAQMVGVGANPMPGVGFGYGGVYDASNNEWYFQRNTGTAINSAYGEILNKDFKTYKPLYAALGFTNLTYIGYAPIIQTDTNYIYLCTNFNNIVIRKSDKQIVLSLPFIASVVSVEKCTNLNSDNLICYGNGNGIYVVKSDLSYTQLNTSVNNSFWAKSHYASSIDRTIFIANLSARIVFLNLTNATPSIDGSEVVTSGNNYYGNISVDGTKLYLTTTASSTFDIINLSTRIKTQVTITELGNGRARYIHSYGQYIYIWRIDNDIIVIDKDTLTYVKTISNVQGAYFGLKVGNKIYCCNLLGSNAGMVSEFDLTTESVRNFATNDFPAQLSYNPITNQIWVGCSNATNGLSVIDLN